VAMAPFPSLVNAITRTISLKKDKSYGKDDDARKVVEAMTKEARKNEMLISSSGIVKSDKSNNFSCLFTKKGQKGLNQDRLIVWEVLYMPTYILFLFFKIHVYFILLIRRCSTLEPNHCDEKKMKYRLILMM
jgi:hypothetical protein